MPTRLDAEIVLRADLEGERLAVEHDSLPRQAFAGQAGRLVFAGVDRERERLLAGEAELVLPLEDQLARGFDGLRRAGERRPAGRRAVGHRRSPWPACGWRWP